jgi:ABC-type transport system involved in multi-copper enzyme maturation permease subunit
VVLALVYILFYSSIRRGGASIQQLLESLPKPLRRAFLGSGVDYLSPAGYLGAEIFSFLAPVLLVVMGILAGSRSLASEEHNGTIDLLLSTPLRRSQLTLAKALGALLPLFLVSAGIWMAVAVVGPSEGLTVDLGALAVALAAIALMAAGFGMIGLLVASATGSAGLGGGVAAAVAVTLYVLNVVGGAVRPLTGFADAVSPFHWVGGAGVLVHGVPWSGMVPLIMCPIVILVVSILVYERRDLTA